MMLFPLTTNSPLNYSNCILVAPSLARPPQSIFNIVARRSRIIFWSAQTPPAAVPPTQRGSHTASALTTHGSLTRLRPRWPSAWSSGTPAWGLPFSSDALQPEPVCSLTHLGSSPKGHPFKEGVPQPLYLKFQPPTTLLPSNVLPIHLLIFFSSRHFSAILSLAHKNVSPRKAGILSVLFTAYHQGLE